jgi:hypothetical protein
VLVNLPDNPWPELTDWHAADCIGVAPDALGQRKTYSREQRLLPLRRSKHPIPVMPDAGHFDQLSGALSDDAASDTQIIAPAGQSIGALRLGFAALVQRRVVGVDVLLAQQINDVALDVGCLQLRGVFPSA